MSKRAELEAEFDKLKELVIANCPCEATGEVFINFCKMLQRNVIEKAPIMKKAMDEDIKMGN